MSEPRQALIALIDSTLSTPATAAGYARGEVSFGRRIDVVLKKGQGSFVVWLCPVEEATGAYRQTSRFKIGHRGEPPDRLGYAVIDALCARVEAWEGSLAAADSAALFASDPAQEPAGREEWVPFFEWLGVQGGLKPACRHVAPAAVAGRLVEKARAAGMLAVAQPAGAFVSGFSTDHRGSDTIVYMARDDAALAAVVAAEHAMIEACEQGHRPSAEQVRALGAALGYPPCCTEAFIPIRDRSNAAIRFEAVRRTPGNGSYLLNQAVDGRVVVSHALCRCDCAPSMRYASALLQERARQDRGGAEQLERALRGLMIVFARGDAFRLVLTGAPVGSLYRYSAVDAAGVGATFAAWRTALAAGDAIEVAAGAVRVLRGAAEVSRLDTPPDDVQIRWFN